MSDPVALYVRYTPGNDPILESIKHEQMVNPKKNLRTIVEGWITENERLRNQLATQQAVIDRLDLLIDIHNSYIIDKKMFAVYPISMKTSDMIRALEDERMRLAKRSLVEDVGQ